MRAVPSSKTLLTIPNREIDWLCGFLNEIVSVHFISWGSAEYVLAERKIRKTIGGETTSP